MSWLAFAVLCVVSIPLVPGRAVHIRRWFGIYPGGNREKIKFGGGVAVTLGISLLFFELLDFDFDSPSRFNLDKIHLNGWYALCPPFRLWGAHFGIFFGMALLMAANEKVAR
jgi:hypothetical protein